MRKMFSIIATKRAASVRILNLLVLKQRNCAQDMLPCGDGSLGSGGVVSISPSSAMCKPLIFGWLWCYLDVMASISIQRRVRDVAWSDKTEKLKLGGSGGRTGTEISRSRSMTMTAPSRQSSTSTSSSSNSSSIMAVAGEVGPTV